MSTIQVEEGRPIRTSRQTYSYVHPVRNHGNRSQIQAQHTFDLSRCHRPEHVEGEAKNDDQDGTVDDACGGYLLA